MTVQEIMDKVGLSKTGFAISYIKDGLEEMALLSETHTKTVRMDINKNQISVKATTTDGTGTIGTSEGWSAFAIATISKID